MAHISLPADASPGIGGLLGAYPKTAKHMTALAQELLRGDSPLSPAERELIAACVSRANECEFCTQSHASVACSLFSSDDDSDASIVDEVVMKQNVSGLSEKMQGLVALALAVQKGGQFVDQIHIDRVRAASATDQEIHDTVLIAAAFCMFNRYVDGLDTSVPSDNSMYDSMGKYLAHHGYVSGEA